MIPPSNSGNTCKCPRTCKCGWGATVGVIGCCRRRVLASCARNPDASFCSAITRIPVRPANVRYSLYGRPRWNHRNHRPRVSDSKVLAADSSRYSVLGPEVQCSRKGMPTTAQPSTHLAERAGQILSSPDSPSLKMLLGRRSCQSDSGPSRPNRTIPITPLWPARPPYSALQGPLADGMS